MALHIDKEGSAKDIMSPKIIYLLTAMVMKFFAQIHLLEPTCIVPKKHLLSRSC